MSDQKLVSPLLDGFLMGQPISSHDGVVCCPAMREETGEKYIVKIISIPSSQSQLDALLLTGAYPNAASAMDYFRQQADRVVKEAEVLKQLAKLQGFMPYESWQVVPVDDNRLGYAVYLLSPYQRSLEQYLKKHTMTRLGAVNLGLGLCEALSICRRAGFMFVDLKPSNIFLTGSHEFRIGDLGFAELDSLKFHTMPGKYRSRYTPPELHDDLSTLNPTADIYAVGMILYEIYNNGQLPFGDHAPEEALPAPLNADYELAEIIQKAIDPNPRKRWQTPIEMGQALVSYMQRNQIADDPIVPPAADAVTETEVTEEPDSTIVTDETAPDPDAGDDLVEAPMTEEVSSMLAQADELISRKLPDPVVVPEAPEIPMPEPPAEVEIQPEKQPEIPLPPAQEPKAPARRKSRSIDEDDDVIILPERTKRSKKSTIAAALLLILLAAAAWGGITFYQDYYLLPIERIDVNSHEDSIRVFLQTDADERLLSVVCTDAYGNTQTMPVVDGVAEFIGLNPATMYKLTVEAEGFHALSGAKSCSYTTTDQTKIVDYMARTGNEDGTVALSFDVEGRDTQDWMIEYYTEGEESQFISFTGHTVFVDGLTLGKTYTFTLSAPAEDLWMVGNTTVEYTASTIVVAENLTITGCVDGVLTAQWKAPADSAVDSWIVRCYSDAGYDQTITTSSTSAEFHDLIPEKAYTVEVTAAGMTRNARAYVSANPSTITQLNVEAPADSDELRIRWEYEGTAADGGWLLLYSIDGDDNQAIITCKEPLAVISPRIPGVTYTFTIQAADGSTVFRGQSSYQTLDTDPFKAYGVSASKIQASLCPTPEKENWTYKDIRDKDYTSRYEPGKNVSIVIYSPDKPEGSEDPVEILYVIRDADGNVVLDLTSNNATSVSWNTLWNNRSRYCTLNIPAVPQIPGQYTVEIYFNRCLLVEKSLTILKTE